MNTNCEICGNPLGYRMRRFCCKKCRTKAQSIRYRDWRTDWQRKKRDKVAEAPSEDKKQCLICGKWYVQVCSHAYQVHGVTEDEYKLEFGFDKKRGVIPEWYREVKRDTNKGIENLKAGKKYWFVKGDKKAGRYERRPQTKERLKYLTTI